MKPPKAVPVVSPAPFAESDVADAVWPIVNTHPQRLEVNYEDQDGNFAGERPARRFSADRANGRYHVGVDLYGSPGDLVRACEDGVVVSFYYFYENTWALLVEHENFVVNYGEVHGDSQKEFKWKIGSKVKMGDSIARVGRLNSGNSMCHFEAYTRGTEKNYQWYKGNPRPERLLNATRYLITLAAKETGTPLPLPPPKPTLLPAVLKSPALTSDETILKVAAGSALLERADNRRQAGVETLQAAFNLLTGKKPAYQIDLGAGRMNSGIFGPQTQRIVRAFQTEAGLPADGRVGRETVEALDKALVADFGSTGAAPVVAPPAAAEPVIVHSYRLPEPNAGATVTGTRQFATKAWSGKYRGDSSQTSGSGCTETTYSDGTIVTRYLETLSAVVDGKSYAPREAGQTRVKKGDITMVEQWNYAWRGRDFPLAALIENHPGFTSEVDIIKAPATRFGKVDPIDSGCGTPSYKIVQTNSDVLGASVKQRRMEKLLGKSWAKLSGTPELLGAMVEVYNPKTKRFARAPLVDVGPAPKLEAEVDLSQSLNEFLGGTGKTPMQFRVLLA